MSFFSDLFSLAGLVTLTLGSIIGIRALSVTWIKNQKNVSVQGNNNIVIINDVAKKKEAEYRLLVKMFACVVFFLYPFVGVQLNSVLLAVAFLSIPLSVLIVCFGFRSTGFSALFGLVNICSCLLLLWIVYRTSFYLPTAAENATYIIIIIKKILALLTTPFGYGENILNRIAGSEPIFLAIMAIIPQMLGFSILIASATSLAFAFKLRNCDDSIRFAAIHVFLVLVSYFLVAGMVRAIGSGDLRYIIQLLQNLLPF